MFKPGQSGNPGGRHRVPAGLRGVARVSAEEIGLILSQMLRMDRSALLEAMLVPGTPLLHVIWARQILKADDRGCPKALEMVMQRLVGPVAAPPEQNTINAELANKTTAELLDIVRKSLPGASNLPELGSSHEVPVSSPIPPPGPQPDRDPDLGD